MGDENIKPTKSYQTTTLWKKFKEKTGENSSFSSAVEKICTDGEVLSDTIITFFPTFTFHNGTHIQGVCNWMAKLLGERIDELTTEETAILLMSACWHDSGMSVKNDERDDLYERISDGKNEQWRNDTVFYEYFEKHPGDANAYYDDENARERIVRNYVREHHHERARKKLNALKWPQELTNKCISRELLADLCQSHGESPDIIPPVSEEIDFELCAILLRLADILDFDAGRAPDTLFKHLGLDHPQTGEEKISSDEFKKNKSGSFKIENNNDDLLYNAQCDDPNIENGIHSYLNWVEDELNNCRKILNRLSDRWKKFSLPYLKEPNIERNGYESGNFNLTMDQDRIIELLTGETLYSDPGVFVRELLQNAIDAVLDRARCDDHFKLEDGKIDIYTWCDEEGYAWFRIEDNGTGMNERIIKNYFLKVGCSYYTSDEYKKTEHYDSSDFKPTSRFGIGILSCFMSDKEHNQVEVETMRFSNNDSNPNKPLRLFVPNLHGSYFLIKEDTISSMKLHLPPTDKVKDKFRRTPGTTICVRVSQFRMGGSSFREILDKYVMFPEVKVTHHDLENGTDKTYKMQAELMESVERLHGDKDEPQEIIHKLPDKFYNELKKKMPEWDWTEESRPELVFTYKRANLFSDNTAGFILNCRVRTSAKCKETIKYDGNDYVPELGISCRKNYENTGFRLDFSVSNDDLNRKTENDITDASKLLESNLYNTRYSISILMSDLYQIINDDEKCLFNAIQGNDYIVSYNGVTAAAGSDRYYSSFYIILLRGSNYPVVDIARERILSLSLETCIELLILFKGEIIGVLAPIEKNYLYKPESGYKQILERHPDWEKEIMYEIKGKDAPVSLYELEKMIRSDSRIMIQIPYFYSYQSDIFVTLYCAALKKRFSIGVTDNWYFDICISEFVEMDYDLSGFPPQLFLTDINQCRLGLNKNICCINHFWNPEHRFSQWLIKHREKLQGTVPEQYNTLLEIMLKNSPDYEYASDYKDINKVINNLKRLKGVSFDITDDLELSEEDFDVKKWTYYPEEETGEE